MKRFHVHISVDDLDGNVRFYSTVFGTSPTVLKPDYAKWMLDDPRINFAISKRGLKTGVDHLGLQVESEAELSELRQQVAVVEVAALDQQNAVCCYARADKYWITDPQGVAWETFHTLESAQCTVKRETQSQPLVAAQRRQRSPNPPKSPPAAKGEEMPSWNEKVLSSMFCSYVPATPRAALWRKRFLTILEKVNSKPSARGAILQGT